MTMTTTPPEPLNAVDPRAALAAEWEAAFEGRPATPAEVAAFYRSATGLKADLDAWHATPERQAWTHAVLAAARMVGARRILDVGAGAGHDLDALRADGGAASPYDLFAIEPNDALREALGRRTPRIPAWSSIDAPGFTAAVQALAGGNPAAAPFDLIVCLDVLEHVPDPVALVHAMLPLLRPGGLLVEATATHDVHTPLHLPQLEGWSPGRLLDRYGFAMREQPAGDRLRIWQKPASPPTVVRAVTNHALVCAYRSLTVETHECLTRLLLQSSPSTGTVWRARVHRGDALISRVRSIAVSEWLRETDGDVFLMIDDDIVFSPLDAERVVALARSTRGIACGAYPVRGGTHLACRLLPGQAAAGVTFGPDLPPIEIAYAATGFMAVHRDVCEQIAATLPLTHAWEPWAFWPLFAPMTTVAQAEDGRTHAEYLSEDYAFCERARALGFGVWLDPRIELTHLGQAGYTVRSMPSAQDADAMIGEHHS